MRTNITQEENHLVRKLVVRIEKVLSIYTLEQANEWDIIVRSFKDYDVYWLSSYVKTFQINGDGEPILFFYDDGSTRGINVVMKRDIAKDPRFREKIENDRYFDFATPYGYGGWLIEGRNSENLFQAYFEWLECNDIICEFVRFHPIAKNHEVCNNYYDIVRLGKIVYMDLSSPEVIWNNLKSENRNRIRKANKNGIRVYDGEFSDIKNQFYTIYRETMGRNNADDYYYFNPAYYQSIISELENHSRAFWAEKDGEIIAAYIMIYANNRMNYHLSGSLGDYNYLAPGNLIMYTAALWGCEKGFQTLLLGGGVGSKDDNLLRFKRTFFKGELDHFYIGKKIVNPEKYNYLCNLRGPTKSAFFPKYRG